MPFLPLAWLAAHSLCPPSFAQEVRRHPDRADTVRLTLGGTADLDAVYRSAPLARARSAIAGAESGAIEAMASVRLTADLTAEAQAGLLLRTERIPVGSPGLGEDGQPVRLREAWIRADQLFHESVSVTFGAQPFAFDLRENGSAFFFDPYNAESWFPEVNALLPVSAPDTSQPAGAVLRWRTANAELGLAFLTLREGGPSRNDEIAYVSTATQRIGEASRAGLLAAVMTAPGPRTRLATFGAGLSYRELKDGLELYGEAYVQRGSAGVTFVGGDQFELKAKGIGYQFGARVEDDPWWVEVNFTSLSGDDSAEDGEEKRFLSYENVNDLLILESNWYGLDLDNNYAALKAAAGYAWDRRLTLKVAWGRFTLNEKAPHLPAPPPRIGKLGREIDVMLSFAWTTQISIHAGAGVLEGSELLQAVFQDDRAVVAVFGTRIQF
ncbi:MAG: hypothetical protein HY716_09770 [Planctomycetes bacterium]|nr:hypothetical protein [Planctomycetota bacterium]